MNRMTLLKIVNPLLAVLALNQATTGLLFDLLPRPVFEIIHQGGGIAFVIAAGLHVLLNWNWIKSNYLRKPAAGT